MQPYICSKFFFLSVIAFQCKCLKCTVESTTRSMTSYGPTIYTQNVKPIPMHRLI